MKKLSQEDTKNLVDSYVQTFGQSGAAKQLSEKGYRSPEGAQILQAHIFRILHGSTTCLLAPDQEDQQQEPPITEEPIAAVPKRAKQIAAELFEDEKLLQQEIIETAAELREELVAEEIALQELERSLPALVPCTADHPDREHRHLERDVKISAVFNRRGPAEIDEDRDFYGIPRMKHSQPAAVVSRPYQPRRYGQNVISSRDLIVREK